MRNTLLLNRGDNTFAEIAQLGGVHASEWSWSPLFLDLDFDGYFPEAFLSNNIEYGYNRAKLAWYVIDPLFQRNSTITPAHIVNDSEQQNNHYVREVFINEVFPNKDQQTGQPSRLRTFDFAFYPNEKGPYNFDVESSEYSAGIDQDGYLQEPQSRWGGVTRKIETNDFEAANIEFIEFWMMDPFLCPDGDCSEDTYDYDHNGGELFINLGNISEDILKDSRKSFENGKVLTKYFGFINELK